MSGLLRLNEWAEFAISIFCSYEKCYSKIMIDSRKIDGLIFCSEKCAKLAFPLGKTEMIKKT